MPIYEYECSDCSERLERLQRLDDPPPGPCECGGTMHRQISAPAFQFKGSGWYVTDYGDRKPSSDGESSGSSAAEKKEKSAAGKAADKGDKKVEKATSAKPSTAGKTN